jgi:hypothetical protein
MKKEFIEIFKFNCPFIKIGLNKFKEIKGYDLSDKPLKFDSSTASESVNSSYFTDIFKISISK